MDWQEIAALMLVAIAFLMLGIKFIKRKNTGALKECCHSGGKNESILFTIKKGEKPKIIIRTK